MEYSHEELANIVSKMTFRNGELIPLPEIPGVLTIEKSTTYPASWHFTSDGECENGVAFYIDPRVAEEFRKPVIFHEIFEAVKVWEMSKDIFRRKKSGEVRSNYHIAHQYALIEEMEYAREILSAEDFTRYLEFANEVRNKKVA